MRLGSSSRAGLLLGATAAVLIILTGVAVYRVRAANQVAPVSADAVTLDPNQFTGEVRQAYLVAREHPELLAQLDCYCGCVQHEGHTSLLDCYRTNHGAGCGICTGEAVTAGKLADQGMPVEQIRAALHAQYGQGS